MKNIKGKLGIQNKQLETVILRFLLIFSFLSVKIRKASSCLAFRQHNIDKLLLRGVLRDLYMGGVTKEGGKWQWNLARREGRVSSVTQLLKLSWDTDEMCPLNKLFKGKQGWQSRVNVIEQWKIKTHSCSCCRKY